MDQTAILKLVKGPKTNYPRNRTVVSVFEQVAKKYPNRVALQHLGNKMNYKTLNEKANQLARHLQKIQVKKQDFVGIYLEHSIDLIVGILGTLKAGAAYVPIDASYPITRKRFMIEDTKIKTLITTPSLSHQFPTENLRPVFLDALDLSSYPKTNLRLAIDPLDIAYINYTSGTTGKPKGVQVPHRGINRLVKNPNWISFSRRNRVLQISNISFDALTFELWGALLNGGVLCIFAHNNYSPQDLGQFILQEEISHIFFTAHLFNIMIEEASHFLKKVRYLVTGGDVMSAKHAKMALEKLPEVQLINGYGPTENTTFSTTYRVLNILENQDSIPIGKPISNSNAYILDSRHRLVKFGNSGELYVGGDGLAKDYLNRLELTAEKFIPNPFGKGRLYRTGDLVRYLPDGNIAFLGRIDFQVKIRGFRIELNEVEEHLRICPGVSDCIVIAHTHPVVGKQLVAYVEATQKSNITPEILNKWTTSHLPSYMVPNFFVILEKLPLTPNGKVDRLALPDPYEDQLSAKEGILKTPTEKTIGQIWAKILHRRRIDQNDHFFQIGGHSILAMQLCTKMKEAFKIEVPVKLIFENPVLEKYASRIDQLTQHKEATNHQEPFNVWRKKEAVLDPQISGEKALPTSESQYTNPKKIFLTGATGFIGAFFLKELIENTDAKIYCLARATSNHQALERLIETLSSYRIWNSEYEKRIVALAGSLDYSLFGLKPNDFQKLEKDIDSIFHIGGFVNYVMSYEQHKRANVLGTQEILRLAAAYKRKPLHFISTTSVVEDIKISPIPEDIDIEKSQNPINGYVQSKWIGEKLMFIARTRGIPCNIFRLPRVSGDTIIGSGPTGDFLWRFIQTSLKLKLAPEMSLYDNLTPVNFLCKAIRIISSQPNWINSQFHVVSPYSFSYLQIFKLLRTLGFSFRWVDSMQWRKLLLNEAEKTNDKELQAIASFLADVDFSKISSKLTFSTHRLNAALKEAHFKFPKIDQKILKKYIEYYVKIGFLPNYN